MEYEEFIELVRQMRDQQNVYFKTRNPRALYAAKALEQKVDNAIKDLSHAQNH